MICHLPPNRVHFICRRDFKSFNQCFLAKAQFHGETSSPSQSTPAAWTRWIPFAIIGLIAVAAFVTYPQWEPAARPWLAKILPSAAGEAGKAEGKAAEEGHAAHGSNESIELSLQGRKNIGLTDEFIKPVKLQPFTKSIRVPGIVVERPGRSVIEVTAPFTGVVTRIYPTEGEALEPGRKLFDLRLTHEDLVQSQADLLQTAAEQEVTDKEIARLEKLAADGTVPGKRLLDLKYEKDKSDAVLRARRQALLLHGLTEAQVNGIVQKRELFKEMTVTVENVATDGKQQSVRKPLSSAEHQSLPGTAGGCRRYARSARRSRGTLHRRGSIRARRGRPQPRGREPSSDRSRIGDGR